MLQFTIRIKANGSLCTCSNGTDIPISLIRELVDCLYRDGTITTTQTKQLKPAVSEGIKNVVIKMLGRGESVAYLQYVSFPRAGVGTPQQQRMFIPSRPIENMPTIGK